MRHLEVSPDGREIVELLATVRHPALVGICGAPGSGKTTLAAALGDPVVPMDGFHLADVELERRGLRMSKGAPETFDAWGYAALLARLREREDRIIMAPGFERGLEQPIAGAIAIPRSELVVTEGNYLLLDRPEWVAVREQLDQVWHVTTDEQLRLRRLHARHVEFGKSPEAAAAWITRVDQPNAVLIEAASARADVVLDLTRWAGALR
ncbi:nucleoside/nucleotide kinase family protein [Nocardioides sp.]|uniref:nucleoside/nucleotide kinase family protein n=1 Tax=Nocardioides sp. TaxID=35761 RepID=UPI003D0E3E07